MEDPCGLPWVVWPSGFTEAVIVLYLDRFCSKCLCKWRFLFHLCLQNIWQKLQGNGGRALYLLVGKKEPKQNCWGKQLIPLLKRGSSCRLERRQHCLGPFSRSLWLIAALLSGMDFGGGRWRRYKMVSFLKMTPQPRIIQLWREANEIIYFFVCFCFWE